MEQLNRIKTAVWLLAISVLLSFVLSLFVSEIFVLLLFVEAVFLAIAIAKAKSAWDDYFGS